ncbi:MAG: hypothetical protein ABJM86_08825 [Hyphomicrobiales bacterium]
MLALIIAAIWSGGSRHGAAVSQNNRNIIHNAKEAEQHIEKTCLNREPAEMAECIRHILEATNQHNRAENDLVAQTEMAIWAFWLLIVSTFALAFTAIGVWFIYRTLSITRETLTQATLTTKAANETVKVTREMGHAQIRAYLSIRNGNYSISGNDIRFDVCLANTGQSPSRRAKMSCKIRGNGLFEGTYFTYSANCDERAVPDLPSAGTFKTDEFIIKDTDIVVSNGPVDNILDAIREDCGMLFFDIQLDWFNVFNHQHTITANLVIDPNDYSQHGIGEYPTFHKLEVKGMEEGA